MVCKRSELITTGETSARNRCSIVPQSIKVAVVVDTISRKAYCHNLLNLQKQPLSIRIVVRLILEVAPYDLF